MRSRSRSSSRSQNRRSRRRSASPKYLELNSTRKYDSDKRKRFQINGPMGGLDFDRSN